MYLAIKILSARQINRGCYEVETEWKTEKAYLSFSGKKTSYPRNHFFQVPTRCHNNEHPPGKQIKKMCGQGSQGSLLDCKSIIRLVMAMNYKWATGQQGQVGSMASATMDRIFERDTEGDPDL